MPGLPDCDFDFPITQVAPGVGFRLYVLVDNSRDGIAGLRTALSWPPDWMVDADELTAGCQPNQVTAQQPSNPGGPTAGIYATIFDCVQGQEVVPIGRIDFLAGQAGCLSQVNPKQGRGKIEVLDCLNQTFEIDAEDFYDRIRLGSICVGAPGNPGCDNDMHPVEGRTWGTIKASYR